MSERYRFVYRGPVMIFDRCVTNSWSGETVAESKAKAKSNLAYQYKKRYNLTPGSKVTLPGEIIMTDELALV